MSVRSALSGLAAVAFLASISVAVGYAAYGGDDSAVVGRYSVVSETGGAVWAFQPDGGLIVVGPGDLVSQGAWTEGPDRGEFDATLAVEVTGQELTILGAVSPGGRRVALYVSATEATAQGNWDPWPPESRLLGDLLSIGVDETPSPTAPPLDCLRPAWASGAVVDWDRCDDDAPYGSPVEIAGPGG